MRNHFLRAIQKTTAPATDPNFRQVALLLHGDGTNGAQNNTFVDSSSNNFSITRNGNTTQGSFSPFSLPEGQWSNFFDGNGDYLSVGNVGSLAGDFTVECWVYFNSSGQVNKNFYVGRPVSTGTGGASFGTFSTADRLQFGASGIAYDVSSTNTIPIRQWVHVAATRSGSTLRLFINGVNDGSVTQTRTYLADVASVGGNVSSATQSFDGYISNMRVVNGTALYTSNFTPPTTPLTAISGTSLLTCQSNRFRDNSSNNFTLTRNGDVRVTAFSPFAPTSAYSPSTNGGSGYFDGTGDFLEISSNAALQVSNSDFTIEGWVYYTNANATIQRIVTKGDSVTNLNLEYSFYVNSTYQLQFLYTFNGSTNQTAVTTTGLTSAFWLNQWHHVAVSKSGTSTKLFIDGVEVGSATIASALFSGAAPFRVGISGTTGQPWFGYMSNIRLIKGTAFYTSAFTPPTAPLTAITNTSLLLNFTNAGIVDNAAKNVIETVGNAQVSTSVTKFGTGSIYFDGVGDYLAIPSNPSLAFGTSPFTVEFWVHFITNPTTPQGLVSSEVNTNWSIGTDTGNTGRVQFRGVSGTNDILGSTTLVANTWYHVAVVREGTGTNQLRIYLNGILEATGTNTVNYPLARILVGSGRTAGNNPLNGYIDDLRITTGIARYTANFTPPTAPYQDL